MQGKNKKYTVRAKKSLGQHFLKSRAAIAAIAAAANMTPSDTILEVGPGKGILTEKLLEYAGQVVAVEKDDRLVEFLKEKFSKEIAGGKLALVHGDILHFNPTTFGLVPLGYKLVANLPYYITGQFLRKFLSGDNQPSSAVLLLQKEVAKRIVSSDGKESILSLSVKAYGAPRYVETVKARYFSPPPQVDSAIIAIEDVGRANFDNVDENLFFSIVKTGFIQKRKLLLNNLGKIMGKDTCLEIFKQCGISERARAEDVPFPQWLRLAQLLFKGPHPK